MLESCLTSWASPSANVADSGASATIVDGEKLRVDSEVGVFPGMLDTLTSAAAINPSRCVLAQSLAFLKAPTPCRNVSSVSVSNYLLDGVVWYSAGSITLKAWVGWIVYTEVGSMCCHDSTLL